MIRGSASTRIFALLGNPVAHSLSPRMQNAAFRAAGLDAVYLALPCAEKDLPALMRSLTTQGGGGNITIPHKLAAVAAGAADEQVAKIGAANIFAAGDQGVRLGNSDVAGVAAMVERLGGELTRWLIIGTGGSARAAVAAAIERGAGIAVSSRRPERAAQFASWAVGIGATLVPSREAELVINATPLGLAAQDPLPIDMTELPALRAVADFTYRADGPTRLIEIAAMLGLRAVDGREMLLAQGASAWSWWFPGVAPPMEVMRAALEGRMG